MFANAGFRSDRGQGANSSVDIDTALRLLADPTRRHLLVELCNNPSRTVALDDAIERCAAKLGDDAERMEIRLIHTDIPALESANLIEFHQHSGDIRYYEDHLVEELLDVRRNWER